MIHGNLETDVNTSITNKRAKYLSKGTILEMNIPIKYVGLGEKIDNQTIVYD